MLPSLFAKELRIARRAIVVRRADGFEKRREWRCGRCGGGVGYEIVGGRAEGGDGGGEQGGRGRDNGGRVMYFFEGALCEMEGNEEGGTEEMGGGGG